MDIKEIEPYLTPDEKVHRSIRLGDKRCYLTDRRLFVVKGFLSKDVVEAPYKNISGIDFLKEYHWGILIAGIVLSFMGTAIGRGFGGLLVLIGVALCAITIVYPTRGVRFYVEGRSPIELNGTKAVLDDFLKLIRQYQR